MSYVSPSKLQRALQRVKSYIDGRASTATVVINPSQWSGTTASYNGVEYHYYTAQLTKVYSEHPVFGIGASGALPTGMEKYAYSLIDEAIADTSTNRITFFAEVSPTTPVVIIVKEAV